MDNMIKSDLENILKEHGHTVYVQRRKRENESGPYRMIDGGRFEPKIEKWTTWRWFRGAAFRNENKRYMTEGYIDGIDGVFYFQAEAMLKTGDLITEDTPHELQDKTTYRVEHCVPYYQRNELVGLTVHCKKLDPIS